jgi:tRNA-dependent cyclodipeptide synthase
MRIASLLNISKSELSSKKFNIFIGISLGNKYFSKERIKEYIVWALKNTKERVAVLIPDKIHAVNYEVKNEYPPERAAAVARRKGNEIERIVVDIAKELKISESKLRIVRWEQIEDARYLQMLYIFQDAFEKNLEFRKTIIDITKNTPHIRNLDLKESQYEKLSRYVIDELPMLISGIRKDGIAYELLPYPGFANIDYLAMDVQEGKTFPYITRKLNIKNKCRFVEIYAD